MRIARGLAPPWTASRTRTTEVPQKHRTLRLTAGLAVALLGLTACGDGGSAGGASSSAAGGGEGKEYTVGINQLISHPALDGARTGFQSAFEDAGLTVTFDEQNAQGDQGTATSIASTFAS